MAQEENEQQVKESQQLRQLQPIQLGQAFDNHPDEYTKK